MEECNNCLSKIKSKNMIKQCLTKKHKKFSNLIINKYFVKDFRGKKIKDILLPYLNIHNKKFERFTVRLVWKKDKVIIDVVNIPNMMILEECYKRTLQDYGGKTISLVSCDVHLSVFCDVMTEKSD